MDFTARSDVEAPIGFVFCRLSDFGGFEKAALRRGAEVVRTDRLEQPGAGARWRASFRYAGKPRRMILSLEDYDAPGHMRFDLESTNLAGELIFDLHELSRGQTRVQVKLRLKPLTITARVHLQTARLAKGRSVKKMQERLEVFARETEAGYRRQSHG